MKKQNSVLICLLTVLILTSFACSAASEKDEGSSFRTVQEMVEVTPERPVKIKLKRNDDGEYSWELSGDDVEKVIETDKRLLLYNKKSH